MIAKLVNKLIAWKISKPEPRSYLLTRTVYFVNDRGNTEGRTEIYGSKIYRNHATANRVLLEKESSERAKLDHQDLKWDANTILSSNVLREMHGLDRYGVLDFEVI